jgi:putative transposase
MSDIRRLQERVLELESHGFPRAADTVERFQFDLMNYQSFPYEHWRRIRTTNLLERVHKEIKRIYRSIGAFPNNSSLLRLAGSILMGINEEWITGRRYLSRSDVIWCVRILGRNLQQFRDTTLHTPYNTLQFTPLTIP